MMVVPEGGSLFEHNMTMVVDGHTTVEHSIPVAKIYDDVRQLWPATKVAYTPTLIVAYGGTFGENTHIIGINVATAHCRCGRYKDMTLRYEKSLSETLRLLLGANPPLLTL